MKRSILLLFVIFLSGCVGHSWYETYGADSKGNNWNKRKCSTHCVTTDELNGECVEFHEVAQPYCEVWRG